MATKDALLETPRPARAILQHLHVMVGFEHEDVRSARALYDQFCHVTEVGDEGDVAGGSAKQKSDGILCVMRNGKSIHKQVRDFKARAGFKQVAVEPGLQLEFKGFLRGAIAVNRDVEFLCNSSQAVNMVVVFMCNENGCEIFRHTTDCGEALADLTRAKAGVHEHAGFSGFDVGAITA